MLLELSITNLAIIEHTRIRFQDGLNALTGETGAGKSILLDALGAVLGARVSSDLVRTGAKSALIEGQFELPAIGFERILEALEVIGIEHDPVDPLILTREIQANGRSTSRINGRLVPAGQLGVIGGYLVDIHGQSDHLRILSPDEQLRILDRYAGLEELRESASREIVDWRTAKRALDEVSSGAREREQRRDLLQYQINEIDEIAPVIGEDVSLARERDVLQNADALRTHAFGAVEALVGEAGDINAITLLRQSEHDLASIATMDSGSQQLAERATEILLLAEDLARDIRDYAEGIEGDPERLQWVDDRLDSLQTLRRKYGATLEEVIAYRDSASVELEHLNDERLDPEVLFARLEDARRSAAEAVMSLSAARQRAAQELAEAIEASIADLRMGNADIEIRVEQHANADGLRLADDRTVSVDTSGIDSVTYLIAPNVGEVLKPLGKIASGGETARIMLAIKSILSEVDETPTLVFDEIDVGVGGRSGQMVGEKLWSLTETHQVIVISHLAQIAAFADKHFRIVKHGHDGRVVSEVEELDPLSREDELAAMLDGIPATPESLANARAMLQRVHEYRENRQR
ncbi:MAG: DNA repair protein RecN [Thermomicrobiales bacterium]|nr:DNA repair protein RecN [Thermomicrobiales bacterium]